LFDPHTYTCQPPKYFSKMSKKEKNITYKIYY